MLFSSHADLPSMQAGWHRSAWLPIRDGWLCERPLYFLPLYSRLPLLAWSRLLDQRWLTRSIALRDTSSGL
jgi:hypothetical protein